jgi:hypothetical protein
MEAIRSILALVIAGLVLIIYLSYAPELRTLQAQEANKLSLKTELLSFLLGISIAAILVSLMLKFDMLVQINAKHYALFMGFLEILGLSVFLELYKVPEILSIILSSILILFIQYLKIRKRTINNWIVLLESISLSGIFLPLTVSLKLYAFALLILAFWDWSAVELVGFMQRLANELMRQGYAVCYRINLDKVHAICLGNGDVMLMLLYPALLLNILQSGLLSILGFFLELLGVYIFIYIIYYYIRRPQPFVPYLVLIQASTLLFLKLLI